MTKQANLQQIAEQIVKDNVCSELAESATQLVFGSGNPAADIVFVGEAPGKNEDQQGLPFVGAAGKFLDKMLTSINLQRKDVYITNIVKYRPPNNRDPLPEEKAAFLPYLQAQIEVIQPKLIVPLGRHSMNCFLPGLQISQAHGQLQYYNDRVYMPLYHPASALYNGSMRQVLLDDFAKIPLILKKLNS